ncbi:MAG: hypothetical protein WA983_11380 [Castellaniella sp.]|uniref:hypothetical protein n=1 Tax=Castellaniella sp. TaxID=1955812 RepID=UPI003C75E572
MIPKKILLLNGVLNGGETYTEYLRQASLNLPENADVVALNIPAKTKMSANQVSKIIDRQTHDVDLELLPKLRGQDVDFLFSNEASLGQYIDPSITTAIIMHGTSVMPVNNDFMFAELISYFDIVTSASKASMQMLANGMSFYRSQRRDLKINVNGPLIRSDLRKTFIMPTRPMKKEKQHTKTPRGTDRTEKFTIGLLPTAIGAIQEKVSLYRSIDQIIQMLFCKFPQSKIVFRPYPNDFQTMPSIKQLCETLIKLGNVTIDSPESPSSTFYDKCDLVITDASTGGTSFMLRRAMPPIYFVPTEALDSHITRWFVDSIGEHVPMAHTISELEKHIHYLAAANENELFSHYENYCNKELFLKSPQTEYFSNILGGNTATEDVIQIDAFGEISYSMQIAA